MSTSIPEHVFLPNLLKTEIIERYALLRGSVFFHPSRYEGFGLSLVEAMSQGLIPVTFAVGIAPEVIKDGQNGFIVSDLDEAEKRVRSILSDAEMRASMSLEAAKAASKFRADAQADALIAIYRPLAGLRRARR
jgi:glycosyltransferase involved in cell wall biosynthesis